MMFEIMNDLVEENVKNYKRDLDIDKKEIKKLFRNGINKFLWMTRESGTELMNYKELFFKESSDNVFFHYYKNFKNLKMFIITIEKIENGIVIGNIEKISTAKMIKEVEKKEKKIKEVKLKIKYIEKGKEIKKVLTEKYTENLFFEILSKMKIQRENIIKYEILEYV